MNALLKSVLLTFVLFALSIAPAMAHSANPLVPLIEFVDAEFIDLEVTETEQGPQFTPLAPNGDTAKGVIRVVDQDVRAHLLLPAGNVYTVWKIDCADPNVFPCQDTGASLGAAGKVVGKGPHGHLGFLLEDISASVGELHIINHGPDIGDPEQYTTPWGGCSVDYGPNQCAVVLIDLP